MQNQRRWMFLFLALAVIASFGNPSGDARASQGTWPADGTVRSLDGADVPLASLRGENGTVLVFLSIECPISNGYLVTLDQLTRTFEEKGVRFLFVNPNASQSAEQIQGHRETFRIHAPVWMDERGTLARRVGASVCPEVFFFDSAGFLAYQGRIDDRYQRRGGAAKEVRSADLKLAIESRLAGTSVASPITKAIGCPIQTDRPKGRAGRADGREAVTYSKEIARILAKHCQECHRPAGIGPFSLLTHADAVSWAPDILALTRERTMPPWKPESGPLAFHGERRLTAEELAAIAAWVENGCPEGDPSDLPAPLSFPEGWRLGDPDLVLEPERDYQLAADGADVYRNFVFPTHFEQDRYLAGYEVLPGNRKVVHHVLLFVDTSGRGERLDALDPEPGYDSSLMAGLPGFVPSSMLGGWAPGNASQMLPAGLARVIPKGARLIMQVHYHKTGKPESDRTRIGLFFTKEPPDRAVGVMPLEPVSARIGLFVIPKGARDHVVRCSARLDKGMTLVSVTPHMHLLGRKLKVTATLPDGTKLPLIHIPDWDFNWQETYYYRQPIDLPPGTRVELEAHYDNSADNPNNPHQPPRSVRYGEQTSEEMCICFLEGAWPESRSPTGRYSVPELDDLFEAQVDRLKTFLGR